MKIKLYNGGQTNLTLRVLAGGFDQETQRVVLIVGGEDGQAGTMTVDPSEARALMETLGKAPVPQVVEARIAGGGGKALPHDPSRVVQ